MKPLRPLERLTSWLFCAFLCAARLFASNCSVSPVNPVAGQTVTVTYDKSGGPLANSAHILLHRGINGWSPVAAPDQRMTLDAGTGLYSCQYVVPEPAYAIDFAFNGVELSSTWDNNSGSDWHFSVTPGPVPVEVPAQSLLSNSSKAHVMMQGFYWDVPAGGTWYDFMASKAAALRNIRDGQGIDRIWFPPPSKGDSGPYSMGYDPYDYYDLGAYSQKGTIACRFGTQSQLRSAISAYRSQGILALADIVANHRGGGASEFNPNTNANTYTDFSAVASGKATWHYNQFHPSTYEYCDDMSFSGFADVCLAADTPDAVGFPRRDLIDWLVWLRDPANAGFDGWRLDLAQGYRPSFIRELRLATGNSFAVMEKWDGNTRNLEQNVLMSGGTHSFDFAAFYTMRGICVSPASANLADLVNPDKVYAARNPARAVTFVENHDTDKDPGAHYTANKMLSYAFILTYQGYPCLFWRDYFDNGYSTLGGQTGNGIDALVWARGALAGGQPVIEVLKGDSRSFLVYGTSIGTRTAMGYLAALNTNSSSTQSASITTSDTMLRGRTLHCYAWYSHASGGNLQPPDVACDASGQVTIQAPPLGYAVYGPLSIDPGPADQQPAFTKEPFSMGISRNSTVTFTAAATGGNLTWQWTLGGKPIPGATSPSLVLGPVQAANSGDYAVVVSNSAGSLTSRTATLGVGIASVSSPGSRLLNISTRSLVGTGNDVQIAGFVIGGNQPKSVLVRAVGPSLAPFGITTFLPDPIVGLYTVDGTKFVENDDWDASIASSAASVGAFALPAGSKDAGMIVTLQPGIYTAIVSGKDNGTGVDLVEVYELSPP